MNWYRSPAVVERLAASYALGTLEGRARRRFEAVMRLNPQIAKQVAHWNARLQPMAQRLTPLAPSEALWGRIEQRAFGGASVATSRKPVTSHELPWWRKLFAPIPAGALAFGLMLGLLPTLRPMWQGQEASDTQLPESYVGVLATPEGKTGMIISSTRHGRVLDLKQLKPLAVPSGQTLFIWALDASGVASPVGPAPSGAFVHVPLAQPADALFKTAVEVAVSVEPVGSTPSAPSAPFVYRGLCGKLWKLPPAPPK